MTTDQKPLKAADLKQFTGTEHWYRHGLARNILYTDGVKHVAETGGAYWLLDEIALSQTLPNVIAAPFQLWRLTVSGSTGILTCEDGGGRVVFSKMIYTDFPLPEIKLHCTNNVILLPSEN